MDMEITHKMGKLLTCALVVTVVSGEVLIAAGETERLPSALPKDTDKAETKEAKSFESAPKAEQQVEVEKEQSDNAVKRAVAGKRNLNEALGTKRVSIFFAETPLTQVLSFLGDLTEIDFIADLEEGVDPLITIRVNSMTLRNVLNWIATLSRTKWGLKDEAVYFSRKTAKVSDLRFYHIRDLMYEPPDFPGSSFMFSEKERGGFRLEGPEKKESRFDPETLIKFIKNIESVKSAEDKKTK